MPVPPGSTWLCSPVASSSVAPKAGKRWTNTARGQATWWEDRCDVPHGIPMLHAVGSARASPPRNAPHVFWPGRRPGPRPPPGTASPSLAKRCVAPSPRRPLRRPCRGGGRGPRPIAWSAATARATTRPMQCLPSPHASGGCPARTAWGPALPGAVNRPWPRPFPPQAPTRCVPAQPCRAAATRMGRAFARTPEPRGAGTGRSRPLQRWTLPRGALRRGPIGSPLRWQGAGPRPLGASAKGVAGSKRDAQAPTGERRQRALTCPRCPRRLRCVPKRCGAMGLWSSVHPGCWRSRLARTSVGVAPHRGRNTVRSYVTSRSISDGAPPTTSGASKPDGNVPGGTAGISSRYEWGKPNALTLGVPTKDLP
jgi:hypothetical protein